MPYQLNLVVRLTRQTFDTNVNILHCFDLEYVILNCYHTIAAYKSICTTAIKYAWYK